MSEPPPPQYDIEGTRQSDAPRWKCVNGFDPLTVTEGKPILAVWTVDDDGKRAYDVVIDSCMPLCCICPCVMPLIGGALDAKRMHQLTTLVLTTEALIQNIQPYPGVGGCCVGRYSDEGETITVLLKDIREIRLKPDTFYNRAARYWPANASYFEPVFHQTNAKSTRPRVQDIDGNDDPIKIVICGFKDPAQIRARILEQKALVAPPSATERALGVLLNAAFGMSSPAPVSAHQKRINVSLQSNPGAVKLVSVPNTMDELHMPVIAQRFGLRPGSISAITTAMGGAQIDEINWRHL